MTITILRVFFVLLSIVAGFYIGADFSGVVTESSLLGAGIGLVISAFIIIIEVKLKSVSLRNLSAAAFGLAFGFFMAWMLTLIMRLLPLEAMVYTILQISFTIVFCYLGMVIAIKGKDEFNVIVPYVRFSRQDQKDQRYILDTSVIIDGRISSICETGFLDGKLIVPRFVLHELQQVADSSDDEKRNRGRRGLDMLDRLKQIQGVEVIIHDERLSSIKEVDAKLVRLGKLLESPIMTNDFNLNKVAKLEGVKVLNINDLASAMRPVVFPGEKMSVHIRKEGKERNQGVAFMDDGTMIVVDNARRLIGKTVPVSVTSVLQTSAGRMIFAALIEKPDTRQDQKSDYRRDKRQDRKTPEANSGNAGRSQEPRAQETQTQEPGLQENAPGDGGATQS
jgi:uncharacterized protein YacL